jgi:catechol 2,3-dioxygenase-like lactoylglutathione lyase family enzyme
MITGTATVLAVNDIAASVAYYRDALGFAVTFEYGQPTFYACLCRDEAALHLIAASETKRQPGEGALCIFLDDVDALHAELVARKAKVVKPPKDYDYGMREFEVVDLDGNQIFFGMGIEKTA